MKHTDDVQIEVENFGPIVKAKFDLRPLTVFVGPSNTGKSYLAILVYALHKYYSHGAFGLLMRKRGQNEPFPWSLKVSDPFLQAVGQVKEQITRKRRASPASVSGPALDEIKALMADDGSLEQEIQRCFGVESASGSLVREGSKRARIQVSKHVNGGKEIFSHGIRITPKGTKVNATMPDQVNLKVSPLLQKILVELEMIRAPIRGGITLDYMMSYGNLVDLLFDSMVSPLGSQPYYLPADRTGIMHANKVVMSAALSNASKGQKSTASLSGVLTDFLDRLINIKDIPQDAGGLKQKEKNGAGIENKILNGEIEISRSAIDYPDFAYLPRHWRGKRPALPLLNASSMVSEIAPIVLFLRHQVVPGNLLIVEEPESHLHPEIQVELMRQLAELVSRGIRVIITTHSEWLMEELSNIVKRSEIPARKRTGRKKGVSLRQDQVGAWLFKPGKRPVGSTISKVGFDDTGYYPTGLEDVAFTLHNDWIRLSSDSQE